MSNKALSVKITVNGSGLEREFEQAVNSIQGLEILHPFDKSNSDLLILQLSDDADRDFQLIETHLQAGRAGEVFLVSRSSEPEMLLKAMRAGAKEFFVPPLSRGEIEEALARFKARLEKQRDGALARDGKIINVIGSKGGVGTTLVATNLAVGLAQSGGEHAVALLDMNRLFGEVPLFLDIRPKYHWAAVAESLSRVDRSYLLNALTQHSSGLYVLSSPSKLNGYGKITPETMGRLLLKLRETFDFVVIDAGQTMDELSARALEISDTILLVSILSLPCLANTRKMLRAFEDLGIRRDEVVRLLMNRYLKKSEITLRDATNGLQMKPFWVIPNDFRKVMSSINQGRPLVQSAPKAGPAKSLRELAELMAGGQEQTRKGRWRFMV